MLSPLDFSNLPVILPSAPPNPDSSRSPASALVLFPKLTLSVHIVLLLVPSSCYRLEKLQRGDFCDKSPVEVVDGKEGAFRPLVVRPTLAEQ